MVTLKDVNNFARRIGLDFKRERFDAYDLLKGMNVEKEHENITGGDKYTTGLIALTHLRERPDYYDLLEKMEAMPIRGGCEMQYGSGPLKNDLINREPDYVCDDYISNADLKKTKRRNLQTLLKSKGLKNVKTESNTDKILKYIKQRNEHCKYLSDKQLEKMKASELHFYLKKINNGRSLLRAKKQDLIQKYKEVRDRLMGNVSGIVGEPKEAEKIVEIIAQNPASLTPEEQRNVSAEIIKEIIKNNDERKQVTFNPVVESREIVPYGEEVIDLETESEGGEEDIYEDLTNDEIERGIELANMIIEKEQSKTDEPLTDEEINRAIQMAADLLKESEMKQAPKPRSHKFNKSINLRISCDGDNGEIEEQVWI